MLVDHQGPPNIQMKILKSSYQRVSEIAVISDLKGADSHWTRPRFLRWYWCWIGADTGW